jgi:diguanylate cyclase
MTGADAQCSKAGSNAPSARRSEFPDAPLVPRFVLAGVGGGAWLMNALLILRSHRNIAYALVVVFLGAVAMTALRLNIPTEIPGFELLLFGWLGVALGRLTMGPDAKPTPTAAEAEPEARPDHGARSDRVDTLLRSIARLLQSHLSDSDAFSERLNGANCRLSQQQHESGPIRDIVLALIDDNRRMRDRLSNVRNQLEESRLHVLQLQNNLERSEEAGMRDVITMIGNRRYFDTALSEELERARATGGDFCLALADLDRFKLVNDRFGHPVGDRLLRLFAEILMQHVRGQDRVARYGGEEFALMLPGASLDQAAEAMERIRRALEAKNWTVEPTGVRVGKVTASFGVAKLRGNETGADLVERADGRLYEAKARGRNCVVAEETDEPKLETPPVRAEKVRRAANG